MNIYKEELLDHYKFPRNHGKINDADVEYQSGNPACGDSVTFSLKIEQNKLKEIKFVGVGCVISQAVASMLTEYVMKKNLDEIMNMTKDDVLNLIKISLGPTRLRCALLPLDALQNGIKQYMQKQR